MSLLAEIYASGGPEVLVDTIEISHPAIDPIRICVGFEDLTLGGVEYKAGGIDLDLPKKDTSGQQSLTFRIDNVTGQAQRAVDDAIDAGGQMTLTYRLFIASQPDVPAKPPMVMTVTGVQCEETTVQVTASYYDLLNTAWPRNKYTAEFAPGIRYL